jgi:hypothetical protein
VRKCVFGVVLGRGRKRSGECFGAVAKVVGDVKMAFWLSCIYSTFFGLV